MKYIKRFNEKFTYIEVVPNKYVYHSSNPIFRDSIYKEGLIVKDKSETWLSDTKIDKPCIFVTNSDNRDDWFESGYDDDIYKIDTSNLTNKWFFDPNFLDKDEFIEYNGKIIKLPKSNREYYHIITFDNIPLSAIKLIYSGNGDNLDDDLDKLNLSMLLGDFLNHHLNNNDLNIDNIPNHLLNQYHEYTDDLLYCGVSKNRNIDTIKCWTSDEETALAFSKKYKDGVINTMSIDEFKNKYTFVSMDILFDYLIRLYPDNIKLKKYVSESEIVILYKN